MPPFRVVADPSKIGGRLRGVKPEWENLKPRTCVNCGKRFKPKHEKARFCQPKCRWEFAKHGRSSKLLRELQERVDSLEKRLALK